MLRVHSLALILLLPGPVRAADVDRYVPDDARMIAQVNLREILDAPLARKYALDEMHTALDRHAEVRQALEALGLDPFRDLQSVTLAGLTVDDKLSGLAIVHGRFDPAKVRTIAEQYAREHPDELKIHPRDGRVVYEAVKKRTVYAALVDREVLLLSPSRAVLTEAVARRGKTPHLSKDLQALVSPIDGRQSAWFAGVVTDDVQKELARSLLGRQRAGQVKSFTGGVRVGDTIEADIHIETSNARTASDLRKVLEGLKALTAFAVANNKRIPAYGPLASDIIRAFRIRTEQAAVTVHARITSAQIEKGLRKGQKP